MNLYEILGLSGTLAVLILTFIQIAPIKINLWSYLARKLGKAITGEALERLDRLEGSVREIKERNEEYEATVCRASILRFGDEIRHGTKHSKEHFDQILLDISSYEHYCDTHAAYANNIALMTIEKIKETYKRCLDEDTFL